MSAPDLVVCGSLTLDNVRLADGTLLAQTCGGNVVYAALGARVWSASVGLVSRAGTDFPRAFLDSLADIGLDLDGVAAIDAPHGLNVAFAYAADGSRVRVFPPEIMATIPPGQRARFTDHSTREPEAHYANWLAFSPDAGDVPAAWASARAVHCASMPVQRHVPLARAFAAAMHVQVDSPWHDRRTPAVDFHSALFHGIDLLLPSEADLIVWRDADPLETAAMLARVHACPLVVKRGAAGSVLIDTGGGMFAVPACAVDAIDPTGAGDAFCGGVLAAVAAGHDPREALVWGTVSSSFAVQAAGLAGLLAATPAEAETRRAALRHRIDIREGRR